MKDNIDIAQYKTSYGSPSWKEKHSVAFYNALCVEQLLGSGATCLGKTVSDEFTYSLDGENFFLAPQLTQKHLREYREAHQAGQLPPLHVVSLTFLLVLTLQVQFEFLQV